MALYNGAHFWDESEPAGVAGIPRYIDEFLVAKIAEILDIQVTVTLLVERDLQAVVATPDNDGPWLRFDHSSELLLDAIFYFELKIVLQTSIIKRKTFSFDFIF